MKIALLEPLGVTNELIEQLSAPLKAAGHTFVYYDKKTADLVELTERAAGCEAVMIANAPFPDEVVSACPDLKMIDVAFTGIDHVGLKACAERGITVCNAAGYSDQTVAEAVIGVTVSLMRKLPSCDAAVRAGGTSAGLKGREIAGRTVGIIGTGRIGMLTAKLFLAFGARVIASSRSVKPEAEALGIEYVSIPELMANSDIISLHVPNNASTRGLIGREMISLMKPDAVFINFARGPIVDSAALADALNEGRIAGAAVDVFNVEPPIPEDEPLLRAKNALLTPHIGFLSEESMIRRARIAFDNMISYVNGKPQNVCRF